MHLEGVIREGVYTMVGGPAFWFTILSAGGSIYAPGGLTLGDVACNTMVEKPAFLVHNSA